MWNCGFGFSIFTPSPLTRCVQGVICGMPIPTYQMHNVLKVFCRRFCATGSGCKRRSDWSTEAYGRQARLRRQALINKVVTDIIEKISRSGVESNPAESNTRSVSPVSKPEEGKEVVSNRFVYHVLDEKNRTVTREFSVDDSDFLLRRIDTVNAVSERESTIRSRA